jgi:hypothetical protein
MLNTDATCTQPFQRLEQAAGELPRDNLLGHLTIDATTI